MNRKAFLIPGVGQSTDIEPYCRIGEMLERRGIEPIGVPVDWGRPGLQELIADTTGFIVAEGPPCVIIGFSLGAVCGLHAASVTEPTHAVLCSLSPFFAEDRSDSPWWINRYGRRRVYPGFPKPEYPVVPSGATDLVFITGAREWWIISRRLQRARNRRFGGTQLVAPGAPHDISHPSYLATVQRVIERW